MKKILITGALGYLGSVLRPYLKNKGYETLGVDVGFFKDSLLDKIDDSDVIIHDCRNFDEKLLNDVYAVVHLAGISNDPVGTLTAERIYDPTRRYALEIAKKCKSRNIKFIFASSCSIYGKGTTDLLNEDSEVFPQTPYSLNKLQVEQDLRSISDNAFQPICLRFATVFGFSPRLRFDLFINMMCGMAVTTGKIIMNSDGLAWRPSLHILDLCKSIEFAIRHENNENDENNSKPLILNVGTDSENHQIKEVAELISSALPGSEVQFLKDMNKSATELELIRDRKINNQSDSRTYKITFSKIRNTFKGFSCDWTVKKGVAQLLSDLKNVNLNPKMFSDPKYYRLQQIEALHKNKQINDDLIWINSL